MMTCCFNFTSVNDYNNYFIFNLSFCKKLQFTGLYYERGCSEKFSVWLKAWSGGAAVLTILIAIVEVCST
jgi:hypothetical protein